MISNPTTRARIGAFALHAKYDSRQIAARATRGFLARFEREVDPDGLLSPEERTRRAEYARRSYMTALAGRRRRAA